MSIKIRGFTILGITPLLAIAALLLATPAAVSVVYGQVPGVLPSQQTSGAAAPMSDTITTQKTATSGVDPLPGHQAHQAVLVLPPRNDGKVWVGTVTWTSSKPVEVVVLHGYNSSVTADAAHGQPLTAPFGGGTIAITLVKPSSGSPVPSGSMQFAGNALAFHTLSGDKFTVTYTVDATAKQLTTP